MTRVQLPTAPTSTSVWASFAAFGPEKQVYGLKLGRSVAKGMAPHGVGVTKDLEFNLRFGFLIHDVSRMRRMVVDRALKPLGLTRSQWWVLAFLSRRDGMTQTALATDLDLTKVAIGGLIDRMEAAGYVERRADERDARARRIYLTKAGQRLVRTIREAVDVVEADITSTISEQELTAASNSLSKVKARLAEMIGSEGEASGDQEAAPTRLPRRARQ